jgi:hypothetical protein
MAPIPGSCPLELRQVLRVEAVARCPNEGNNARKWWVVTKSERMRTACLTSNWCLPPFDVRPKTIGDVERRMLASCLYCRAPVSESDKIRVTSSLPKSEPARRAGRRITTEAPTNQLLAA